MNKFIIKTIDNFLNRNFIVLPFNLCINKSSIKLFNKIYEKSPHIFQEIFTRLLRHPEFDFTYQIELMNGKKIYVNVRPDYKPSYELALSYKWHDIGIRNLEKLLNDYYPKSDYYLDIGANHGLRSLYALSINRPTILFEPNYNLNNFVNDLFNLNNFSNFKLENLCLSDENGVAKFYISGSSYMSSLNPEHASSDKLISGIKEIEVPIMILDEYYQRHLNGKKVSIIKIDVEGHEYHVLKGAKEILNEFHPSILIEILPDDDSKNNIFTFLKSMGYKAFGIINKEGLNVVEINKPELRFNNYFLTTVNHILDKVNIQS